MNEMNLGETAKPIKQNFLSNTFPPLPSKLGPDSFWVLGTKIDDFCVRQELTY